MTDAIGLYREKNRAGLPEKDFAIATEVGKRLQQKGINVKMLKQLRFSKKPDLIFSMARNPKTLKTLQVLEKKIPVINSPTAVLDCLNRVKTYKLLLDKGIPLPKTQFVETRKLFNKFNNKIVLKRGNTHGMKGDSAIIENTEQYNQTIESFLKKKTKTTIVQAFVLGRDLKFYGIGDQVFLPDKQGLTKKQLMKIEQIVSKTGKLTSLKVYGGDLMITRDKIFLLDINDWPTFSPIRDLAAEKISDLIINEFNKRNKK